MSTSVASATKYFPTAQNGFQTTLASTISSGAATVPLNSVAGYTNGDTVVLVVDPTSSTLKQTFTGVVDTAGVQITGVVWTAGTNVSHAGGATVVDYETATHWALYSKGLLIGHTQAGLHIPDLPLTTPKITTGIKDSSGNVVIPMTGSSSTTSIKLSTTAVGLIYIESGCVWTADSAGVNRNGSMTAGVVYINGVRLTAAAITAHTFTASKDTYVDFADNADGTVSVSYNEVANNAASPALSANRLRNAIIVTAAGSIAAAGSVNQGEETKTVPLLFYTVTDSLGNLICPRSPSANGMIGHRRRGTDFSTISATPVGITGLNMAIIVPTARKVKITLSLDAFGISGAGQATLSIWDGVVGSGTEIATADFVTVNAGTQVVPAHIVVIVTASGSKSYNAGLNNVGGVLTATAFANATGPAIFMAELL
jgi:hypothetical protein